MNILLFITPKTKVAYLYSDFTVRQALEKMEHHRYSAIPVIHRDGTFAGILTEGDLLWTIKNKFLLNLKAAESFPISKVARRISTAPISVHTNMDDLVSQAMSQNFVPVADDRGMFIGIITRKAILEYLYKKANGKDLGAHLSSQPMLLSQSQ